MGVYFLPCPIPRRCDPLIPPSHFSNFSPAVFFPVSMSLVAICFPLSLVCACVDGNFVSAFVSAFSACDEGWVFFFSWMGGRGVTTGLDLA